MAAFKVGQRVRIVRSEGFHPGAVGKEAVIVGPKDGIDDAYEIAIKDYPQPSFDHYWATASQLAPLLPPDDAADQFIAKLKKLGSEPVNDAPKVTVREAK